MWIILAVVLLLLRLMMAFRTARSCFKMSRAPSRGRARRRGKIVRKDFIAPPRNAPIQSAVVLKTTSTASGLIDGDGTGRSLFDLGQFQS